jgi:hypothetical protein
MTFNIRLKIAKGLFELDATIELRRKRKKPRTVKNTAELKAAHRPAQACAVAA